MNATSIPANIIPVVVEFTAKPGDSILVVNGVCVGLAGQPPASYQPMAKRKRNYKYSRRKGSLSENPLRVITTMHASAIPLTATEIIDLISPGTDTPARNLVRSTITNLRHRGILSPVPHERNSRSPHFQLSTKGAKIAREHAPSPPAVEQPAA